LLFKSTWNDLYIDRRRQKISTVTLLQTESTPLGRHKSTQVDLLDPNRRASQIGCLFFTAPCYSIGAVLPSYGVCPSVGNVGERWSHTLS